MKFFSTGATTPGQRGHNEDDFSLFPIQNLYVVVDGMGGSYSGAFVGPRFTEVFYRAMRDFTDLETGLREAFKAANSELIEYIEQNVRLQGSGATFSAVQFSGDQIGICHVGDCRVYRWRDNALSQLTRDHTLRNERLDLPPSPQYDNVITRAVGFKEIELDVSIDIVQPGDTYLLCSDGVSDVLSDKEIAGFLENWHIDSVVHDIIERIETVEGVDNATAVAVRCSES